VDNELSSINSWKEVHEKGEAALRPSIQNSVVAELVYFIKLALCIKRNAFVVPG
jgi:hypothetical protein